MKLIINKFKIQLTICLLLSVVVEGLHSIGGLHDVAKVRVHQYRRLPNFHLGGCGWGWQKNNSTPNFLRNRGVLNDFVN